MKRGLWITAAGLVVFAAILIARLPASWVIPTGPKAPFTCASIEGSVWNGACNGLSAQRLQVGDLAWELHPAKLFTARLAAHLTLTRTDAHASTDAELGFGQQLTVRNLVADLPLERQMMPGLPPTLHGSAHLDLALLQLTRGALTQLKGTIEAHDLVDRSGNVTPLGSYAVTFPGGEGEPVGQIRDLDGPLNVAGTLKLTRQGGYEVEGLVGTRPGASPELINNMRYLGSPDASGRRNFSLSGTF
jgi:general secretion pathway protein N